MKAEILESERLVLKPLGMQHLSDRYVQWLNDKAVYDFLDTRGGYTIRMLSDFLQKVEKDNILFWAIHLKSNDLHIGNIKIDPVNKMHLLGEYGILIGDKDYWGKGFAREATNLVIDYCFEKVGLRKITLGVIPENSSALNLYLKIGFVKEGLYKRHFLYDGKYYDSIRMAKFNPKFLNE